jgi:hypothetical protein
MLYGLIDAAYKEGYAAYASKEHTPCPYFNHGGRNPELEPLYEAWMRGYYAANSDELDRYMEGLSRLNADHKD